MRIRHHEQARLDIQRGISFYESQSSGLGAYFKSEIIAAIDSLRYFPPMYPMVRGYRRMFVGKFPYGCSARFVCRTVTPISSLLAS